MQEIMGSLGSVGWWFSTIIIALGVNIVSAYLKGPLDAGMSRLSTGWRNRSERSQREFANAVSLLAAHPDRMAVEVENEFRSRLQSIGLLTWCFGTFLLTSAVNRDLAPFSGSPNVQRWWLVFVGGLTLVTMVTSLSAHTSAMRCRARIIAARALQELA